MPSQVPFGAHELRFSAIGADASAVRVSVWFSVGETGLIEEISTTGPVAEPERTPRGAPEPVAPAGAAGQAGEAGAKIASTGVETFGWLAGAGVLLLSGLAAMVLARRRGFAGR